jgi:decaprenylphospho-beta-D-ribofuranose 2-oxidase
VAAEFRRARGHYVSFDGSVRLLVTYARPDRYRFWRAADIDGPVISRGAGLSYVAASFGGGATTLEHDAFNRILEFDPLQRTVKVEAGLRLGDLFSFLAPRGFYLPTQPGHPSISVGGCVAADVHGKNQPRDGTFRRQVLALSLFHPRHGILEVCERGDADVLELTCGGYGLTGTILDVTLRIAPLASEVVEHSTIPLPDISSLREDVDRASAESDFIFTWHDFMASGKQFGRGVLDVGRFASPPQNGRSPRGDRRFRPLRAETRRRWRIPVFNLYSARAFTTLYHAYAARPRSRRRVPLFASLYPIVGRETYFELFGTRGFFEYQALIPDDAFLPFVQAVQRRLEVNAVPVTLASTKTFVGEAEFLRFDGTGMVLALNLPRSRGATEFMRFLDQLVVELGAKPNIIKDSRLPREVVMQTYSEYERFRSALREYDRERVYRSALSDRLGL